MAGRFRQGRFRQGISPANKAGVQGQREELRLRDSRLDGFWVSDRERTLVQLQKQADLPEGLRGRLALVLGRMVLEYRADMVYTWFDRRLISAQPFEVLSKEPQKVRIRVGAPDSAGQEFVLRFSGDCYWVATGRHGVRECFRRMDPARVNFTVFDSVTSEESMMAGSSKKTVKKNV